MSVYHNISEIFNCRHFASIHSCYGFTSELEACPNVIKLCLFSSFLKSEYADYKVLDSADRNINYGAGWECDDYIVRGWYRFTGAEMASRSV